MKSVKLVIHKETINKKVESLKEHVNSLRMLLESCSTITYSSEKGQEYANHQRRASAEQKQRKLDSQFFDDFYEALGQSFRCQCGVAHEANLRISDSLEIMFPVDKNDMATSEIHARARSGTFDSVATAVTIEAEDMDSTKYVHLSLNIKSVKPC
jgi:hypothetical protein